MPRSPLGAVIGALALACTTAATAVAQEQYPNRPITFIVPYGAGGSADIGARTLVKEMEKALGTPIVVQNVGGGGGAVGLTQLFNAEPDGYTIGLGTGSNTTIAPHAVEVGYSPLEFTYVAGFFGYTYAVFLNPSVPVDSVKELTEWAKDNPGKLINGTTGGYSIQDVAMALLSESAGGIEYRTLPSDSAADSTLRLLAGDANVAFGSPATYLEHVKAGTLKALGVVSDLSVPALDELGLEKTADALGFSLINRAVILAPPGLPDDIRTKLESAVKAATETSAVQEQQVKLSNPLLFKPGPEAQAETADIYDVYGKIIKRLIDSGL